MKKILPENKSRPEMEVKELFAGGAIRIEREFDEKLDRVAEYVNILGVRVRRRDPENDANPLEEGGKLPGNPEKTDKFKTLSFGPAELEFLRAALMRYSIGQHSLFLGPPGFGKSRMVEFFAYLLNVPFFRVQCERGMEVQQQFLWTYAHNNGGWKARLGPLPQSMVQGGIILVDELPNLEPAERQVILEPTERPHNPVLSPEDVPSLHMQDYPGHEVTVRAAPGWFLVATGNYREGQGVDEIFSLTEREERRVRPFMLGQLPAGTSARRMAAKYRKKKEAPQEGPQEGPTEGYKSHPLLQESAYYPPYSVDLPDEVVEMVTEFFDQVHTVVTAEILKDLRQDPKVFLREAEMRAFDHFMRFLVMDKPDDLEAVLLSAFNALEFYYINSFRDETKVKVPPELLGKFNAESESRADAQGRAPVKAYLAWRLYSLLTQTLWQTSEGVKVSFRGRLSKFLTGESDEERLEREKNEAEKKRREEEERKRERERKIREELAAKQKAAQEAAAQAAALAAANSQQGENLNSEIGSIESDIISMLDGIAGKNQKNIKPASLEGVPENIMNIMDEIGAKVKNVMTQSAASAGQLKPGESVEAVREELVSKMRSHYRLRQKEWKELKYTDPLPQWEDVEHLINILSPVQLMRISKFQRPTLIFSSKSGKEDLIRKIAIQNGVPSATVCQPAIDQMLHFEADPTDIDIHIVEGSDTPDWSTGFNPVIAEALSSSPGWNDPAVSYETKMELLVSVLNEMGLDLINMQQYLMLANSKSVVKKQFDLQRRTIFPYVAENGVAVCGVRGGGGGAIHFDLEKNMHTLICIRPSVRLNPVKK